MYPPLVHWNACFPRTQAPIASRENMLALLDGERLLFRQVGVWSHRRRAVARPPHRRLPRPSSHHHAPPPLATHQIPLLEIDGHELVESTAITR